MILTYITHDTPDEQRTIDDVQSVLIDTTAPLSSFKMGNPGLSGVGAADMHDTLSRNTSILVVEKQTPAKEKEKMQGEQPGAGGEETKPFPFVLLDLCSLEKKKFLDEGEACSRLNVCCEAGDKFILLEWNNIRKCYIPSSFNTV
jgi:hypothetical protein